VFSYEVLHDMAPSISKFDFRVSTFWPAARPMKVKADWPQKLITLVADHMLFTHQVWSWSDNSYWKNKGFVDILLWPNMTLTLTSKWCHHWVDGHWETTIQEMLYRCKACWVRKLPEQQWLYTKKWTMSPIGQTVSCKSPPHIRACIDSGSPFGHALIPAFGHT
jgi:hypothetical protein